MPIFKSLKEKRLWLYTLIVFIAIFSSLLIGSPLQRFISDQKVQVAFFSTGMILTGAVVLFHGLKIFTNKIEMVIWVGLATVYLMLIFRVGTTERSHLIEYSILAIFIHKAIIERNADNNKILFHGLKAFIITCSIGILDEVIQKFIPNRVFDAEDILFNSLAALMAVGGSILLQWAKAKFRRNA